MQASSGLTYGLNHLYFSINEAAKSINQLQITFHKVFKPKQVQDRV